MSLERSSIYSQLADRIETLIRSGTWTSVLPGVRTLAVHFHVNPKTCTAAIELLEGRGVVAPTCPGVSRRILIPPDSPSTRLSASRLLILHNSTALLDFEDRTLLQMHHQEWERTHGDVIWSVVDYGRYRAPGTMLSTLIDRHRADALLLHMPSGRWSAEASILLPTYQLGGIYHRDTPVSLNAFALEPEISRMVRRLRDLGHDRILIPTGSIDEGMRRAVIEGLTQGMGGSPARGKWGDYCPRFAENVPQAWPGYWHSTFSKHDPTAVILLEGVHLLSLHGYCSTRQILIPEDLSVALMSWDPHLEWCYPQPAMNRYPLGESVSRFQKWLAGGMRPTGRKLLNLEYVEGGSLAPPKTAGIGSAHRSPKSWARENRKPSP